MNLTFLSLCLACMGVSLAEGILMNLCSNQQLASQTSSTITLLNDHGNCLY